MKILITYLFTLMFLVWFGWLFARVVQAVKTPWTIIILAGIAYGVAYWFIMGYAVNHF